MRDDEFKEKVMELLRMKGRLGTDEIQSELINNGISYTRQTLLKKLNKLYNEGLLNRGMIGWTYVWKLNTESVEDDITIPKALYNEMVHALATLDGLYFSDNPDFIDSFKLDCSEILIKLPLN